MRLVLAALCLALVASVSPATASAGEKGELWLYYPMNLLVDKNLDKAEGVWARAGAAGYTHVLLADSKFSRLSQMSPGYFKNCERAKAMAARNHLQIVPALFSVGYSNDLLSNDPNLAEGLPVKDQPFVIRNGVAEVVGDPAVRFNKIAFKDNSVEISDGVATVRSGKPPARFTYKLTVPEYRCYHVSVKIKTEDFHGHPEIKALAGDSTLQWQNLSIKPTQDWTQCDVVFNSLNHTQVGIYFGIWSATKGTLQWKDWKIEEVGLLNLLCRPGAPCVVKDESGKVLKEGTDYEPIVDPLMGTNPWKGEYQSYHASPALHAKLPDGTRLRVSWYHPAIIYDGQVTMCIGEPKTAEILADQAQRVKKLWNAPLYMMSHDEFRTCGWDEACDAGKQTPGKLLSDNLQQCTKLLRPARAAVWNDMFDPHHNAVKGPYYLVKGPLTDSWNGLEKDVLIINWNHGKRDESLKFFADRGNQQLIAGYYDNDLAELSQWKASASKVQGVIGYMYTTWQSDYSKVEEFAKMVGKE